jgi:hypothetical protein
VARDRDPQCKQCRREGEKLFLKGARCSTEKCAIERRNYPPGHNGRGRIRQSEYLMQLREKQRARRYYGVLEKQFRRYYEKASRQPGVTGENLLRLLELRLDNVVTRLGFAASRRQGRSGASTLANSSSNRQLLRAFTSRERCTAEALASPWTLMPWLRIRMSQLASRGPRSASWPHCQRTCSSGIASPEASLSSSGC